MLHPLERLALTSLIVAAAAALFLLLLVCSPHGVIGVCTAERGLALVVDGGVVRTVEEVDDSLARVEVERLEDGVDALRAGILY